VQFEDVFCLEPGAVAVADLVFQLGEIGQQLEEGCVDVVLSFYQFQMPQPHRFRFCGSWLGREWV
jgi:hypothetical protein